MKTSTVKPPKKFALDIFSILSKLNAKDLTVWDNLSDEERKGFSPYIIARWMSGTNDPMQIILLNELVNPNIFSKTGQRTDIMCKLLAICGTGQSKRFKWIPESKKAKKKDVSLEIVKEYYDITTAEALHYITTLDNSDVLEMAEELGYQQDELKKLKKDLGGD